MPLISQQGRDLLEIGDDRHGRGSTIVTSQLPVDHWHEVIVDPTIADAVLDVHSLALDGATLRKPPEKSGKRGKLDTDTPREPLKPSTGAAVRDHRNAARDRSESLSAIAGIRTRSKGGRR